MSHELRTPLNAILGFSEVMKNEVLGPMQNATYRGYAGDIHASGEHLLALINEILDLSRIEAGRYELNEEPVTLAHVIEDCENLVRLRARNKNLKLTQEMEPNLPRLWADERAVRQVVLNLLSNAIKFTPPGGEIAIKAGWTAGGGQYVSIRDNGPGIAEEELPIVMSAFGRGAIAIKSAEQGTGLGLPIVQAMMRMHDGTFELRSRLREGTEAIACFPRSRVMDPLPPVIDEFDYRQDRRKAGELSPEVRRAPRPPAWAKVAMPPWMSAAARMRPAASAAPRALAEAHAEIEQRPQRPIASSRRPCAGSAERWPNWQWSSAVESRARRARQRRRSRHSRRRSPGCGSCAPRGSAPAMAASSRPPSRRSTSSGSSRWPAWVASAWSTTAALWAMPSASRPVPRPTQSRPLPPNSPAADRRRPRSCCRCPSRRARSGRRRRRSPPCRRPWSRRRRASSIAGSIGDIAGRDVEREVEHLEAEIVGDADLVDRRAAGGEILHHLAASPKGGKGGDAARRDAVIAGEDGRPAAG